MVHAGEYSEPLSHTAGSDGNFRVADYPGTISRGSSNRETKSGHFYE
jgi:hypothetical protein